MDTFEKLLADTKNDVIDLNGSRLALPYTCNINRAVTIKNATFLGTSWVGKEPLVSMNAANIVLKDCYVMTDGTNASGVRVNKVKGAVLDNCTIDNRNTSGGAPIIVDSGSLVVKNGLELRMRNASWYGIGLDANIANATLDFDKTAFVKINLSGNNVKKYAVVCKRTDNFKTIISGGERLGLVESEQKDSYVLK